MSNEPALDLLTELARKAATEPSATHLARGLDALSGRVFRERRRRPLALGVVFAGGTSALALAVFLALLFVRFRAAGDMVRSGAPLPYTVSGGTVVEGGYLREAAGGGMTLAFAGGTELRLPPGTRGRLRAADETGARIAIEQGTASFEVVPHAHRKWLVEAGPFLVTVQGTAFTVSWDGPKERFELQLTRGRVAVSGPLLSAGGDITLEAGHRLSVDLARAETLITEIKPQAEVREPPPAAPEATGPQGAKREGTRSPWRGESATAAARVLGARHDRVVIPGAPARGWPAALAEGRLDDILGDVQRAGLTASLARAPEEDLFALADAARYRRRLSWAREALLTARRRFSSSPRAVDAAYLLGRVEELSDQGTPVALRWYETYLAAAPQGTFAAEALGRRMILVSKQAGSAAAQPLADEYLRRFPRGTYAGSARALRSAP